MDTKNKKKPTITTKYVVSDNKRHFIAFAILIISVLLAYSNSINGSWAMDDILANKAVGIKDLQDFVGSRKIAYLTFLLNQYIAPFSPANFRLFNILIHIANSALVYVLAFKTVTLFSAPAGQQTEAKSSNQFQSRKDPAFYTALLSSIIFALHPININAVAYIVQRMASLATLFVLLALGCYISASQAGNRLKAAAFYVLSSASIIAGIFSKENAVMALPLILVYDYVFISKLKGRLVIKKFLFISGIGLAGIALSAYFLSFHLILRDLFNLFINYNQPLTQRIWMAIDVYWTPLQHLLTGFRVVTRYIFLILAPLPQFLVFDWWGFPVSKSLTDPATTILAILFLVALFTFSIWKIKRFPLLCFGILWYLIAISLESFIAVGSDLYFEHRNYLPVSGLIIGLVGQVLTVFSGKLKTKTVWAVTAAFCLLFGSLTFARNLVWKDSVTLWEDAVRKHPSNLRALMSAGNAWLKVQDFDKTKYYYKEAIRESNRSKRDSFLNAAVYRLGMTYLFERNLTEAERLITAMENSIESYNLDILKGFYKAAGGDVDSAIAIYEKVLPKATVIDLIIVNTLMGDAYREKGLWNFAIERYQKALALDPAFAAAYYGLGVSYMANRNLALANDYLSKTLELEPNNILALSDMADLMLLRQARLEDALAYATKAVSRPSPFYQPYLTMGNLQIILGKENEAEDFYKKALERGMPNHLLLFSKARSYYMKGDKEKANFYLSEFQKHKRPENIKNLTKGK